MLRVVSSNLTAPTTSLSFPPARADQGMDEEDEGMNASQADLEPWQWPEEQWRKLVNRVRAGRR